MVTKAEQKGHDTMKSNRLSLFLLKTPFMYGAEGEPEGTSGAEGSGDDPKGGETGSSASGSGDPQKKIAALEEEKNRHFSARQKAEQENADFKARLQEYEDKGKSEAELKDRELSTLKEQNAALQEALQDLRIRNAFLSANTVEWHNPERALALVDLSEVQIDKDGNVDKAALKAASEALAKSDSYLVKVADKEDKGSGGQPKSGENPKGSDKDKGTDKETLRKKYPALRTH